MMSRRPMRRRAAFPRSSYDEGRDFASCDDFLLPSTRVAASQDDVNGTGLDAGSRGAGEMRKPTTTQPKTTTTAPPTTTTSMMSTTMGSPSSAFLEATDGSR